MHWKSYTFFDPIIQIANKRLADGFFLSELDSINNGGRSGRRGGEGGGLYHTSQKLNVAVAFTLQVITINSQTKMLSANNNNHYNYELRRS